MSLFPSNPLYLVVNATPRSLSLSLSLALLGMHATEHASDDVQIALRRIVVTRHSSKRQRIKQVTDFGPCCKYVVRGQVGIQRIHTCDVVQHQPDARCQKPSMLLVYIGTTARQHVKQRQSIRVTDAQQQGCLRWSSM